MEGLSELVAAYGWYMLGVVVLGAWLWHKYNNHLWKWLEDREDNKRMEYLLAHPEVSERRMRELDEARQRMQVEYDAKAALAAEKRKELEERRRQEFLEKHDANPGHRLSDSQGPSQTVRAEYNPLMGPSGSGQYRPTRRSCPGGNCGR